MRLEINHLFLSRDANLQNGQQRVLRFLERSILVSYARVELLPGGTRSGADPRFAELLEAGLARNQAALSGLSDELEAEGIRSLADLTEIPQGYHSKLLHTMAHLLDGFFGIDSAFYNLAEDSHLVSDSLRREIQRTPGEFWLIDLKGASEIQGEITRERLRTFETEPDTK